MKGSYLNDGFFSRLETLALNLRADLLGFFGGKHLVKTYGQTVEFADYREYMLGDDIRRIDWNLYSRFEKYFLKLFTDERQMHVQIFLDCSASMGKDNPAKAQYAIGLAAAMGFLAVHNMDKVTFNLIKGDKAENPFGTLVGKTSFFNAISRLESIEFDGEADVSAAVSSCSSTGTNDGITVIISDLMGERDWKKAVDFLSYKKRQVMLFQVLTPDEIDPSYNGRFDLIDSESLDLMDDRNIRLRVTRSMLQAYEEAMRDFMAEIKDFCMSRNTEYIVCDTSRDIEKLIFGDLLKVGVIS